VQKPFWKEHLGALQVFLELCARLTACVHVHTRTA